MGKFLIHSQFVANHKPAIPRLMIKREDYCVKCGKCTSVCIFEVHKRSQADPRKMVDPDMEKCKFCFTCVQSCPKEALSIFPNPEYQKLGDQLFTPEIITTLIKEGQTGETPISGGGYGGKFTGEGFDGFWTDMSEIVRPTRDGIHAREYISTLVELGRKPADLTGWQVDTKGNPLSHIAPSREINLPMVFDLTRMPLKSESIIKAVVNCASQLNTLVLIELKDLKPELEIFSPYMVISLDPRKLSWGELVDIAKNQGILELLYSPELAKLGESLKNINPELIVMVRAENPENPQQLAVEIYTGGADVIHFRFDHELPEKIRAAHLGLVEAKIRDRASLLISGNLAEAAHIPKSIILGADALALDWPLLVAMECLVCKKCLSGEPCPRQLESINPEWGAARIKNLMASWHNQMLEILGAMGIREVSRLRGEVGRAIFYSDLEREFSNEFKR